jgi:hypothetical protein
MWVQDTQDVFGVRKEGSPIRDKTGQAKAIAINWALKETP